MIKKIKLHQFRENNLSKNFERLNIKFIRVYLILFLIYIIANLFMGIYSYYYIKIHGPIDDNYIFGFFITILLSLFLFFFILFNIYFLIVSIIKKFPKILVFLSLSEFLFLLILAFGILGLLSSINISFSGAFIISYILKIFQLIITIYLLAKLHGI